MIVKNNRLKNDRAEMMGRRKKWGVISSLPGLAPWA